MPGIRCGGCGRQTNTACSNAWEKKPLGEATKCYLAFVDDVWVKGCGFDELDNMRKKLYWQKEWGKCPIKKIRRSSENLH